MESTSAAARKFLDPDAIISQLDIAVGSIVADFGCGPGYFSLPFAKAVEVTGKVFALDVLPQVLETVLGKAKNAGIVNIVTSRVNLEKEGGSKLPDQAVNWVVLKDILFQNKNKEILITEAYRILKPGGKVVVAEWNERDAGIGPDSGIRISEAQLKELFKQQGFSIEKELEAGSFHYAFVAIK